MTAPGRAIRVAVVAASLAGCGGTMHPAGPPGPSSAARRVTSPAHKAADVTFADRLTAYSRGALALAGEARGRASDPSMLELAAGLRTVQQGDAQEVADWFRAWGLRPPGAATAGGPAGVPSAAQLSHLSVLTGPAFDRAFVKLVIADQQGALHAATAEQQTGSYAPARQLATQIVSASALAIVRLKHLLKAHG